MFSRRVDSNVGAVNSTTSFQDIYEERDKKIISDASDEIHYYKKRLAKIDEKSKLDELDQPLENILASLEEVRADIYIVRSRSLINQVCDIQRKIDILRYALDRSSAAKEDMATVNEKSKLENLCRNFEKIEYGLEEVPNSELKKIALKEVRGVLIKIYSLNKVLDKIDNLNECLDNLENYEKLAELQKQLESIIRSVEENLGSMPELFEKECSELQGKICELDEKRKMYR